MIIFEERHDIIQCELVIHLKNSYTSVKEDLERGLEVSVHCPFFYPQHKVAMITEAIPGFCTFFG